jgi:hypothetical protein
MAIHAVIAQTHDCRVLPQKVAHQCKHKWRLVNTLEGLPLIVQMRASKGFTGHDGPRRGGCLSLSPQLVQTFSGDTAALRRPHATQHRVTIFFDTEGVVAWSCNSRSPAVGPSGREDAGPLGGITVGGIGA